MLYTLLPRKARGARAQAPLTNVKVTRCAHAFMSMIPGGSSPIIWSSFVCPASSRVSRALHSYSLVVRVICISLGVFHALCSCFPVINALDHLEGSSWNGGPDCRVRPISSFGGRLHGAIEASSDVSANIFRMKIRGSARIESCDYLTWPMADWIRSDLDARSRWLVRNGCNRLNLRLRLTRSAFVIGRSYIRDRPFDGRDRIVGTCDHVSNRPDLLS
jgi:hypothetical protein